MSFALSLWVGRFDLESKMGIEPLDIEQFAMLFAPFADPPDANYRRVFCNETGTVMGSVQGKHIIFDHRGFICTTIAYEDTALLFRYFAKLVQELGCDVYAPDAGEYWTDTVLRQSGLSKED